MALYNTVGFNLSLNSTLLNNYQQYTIQPYDGMFDDIGGSYRLLSFTIMGNSYFYWDGKSNNQNQFGQWLINKANQASPYAFGAAGAGYGSRAGFGGAAVGGIIGIVTGFTLREIVNHFPQSQSQPGYYRNGILNYSGPETFTIS